MADYYLVIRRTYDYAVKGELRLVGDFSYNYSLNGFGEFRGTVSLDDLVGDPLGWTVPATYHVSLMRNSKLVWGGFIWDRDVDPLGRTIEIAANEWGSYLRWFAVKDDDWDYDDSPYNVVGNILNNAGFQFPILDGGGLSANVFGTFPYSNHSTYLDMIDALAKSPVDGFDYRWTTSASQTSNSLYQRMIIGNRLGASTAIRYGWWVGGGVEGGVVSVKFHHSATPNNYQGWNAYGDSIIRYINSFPAPDSVNPDPPMYMFEALTYPEEIDDDKIQDLVGHESDLNAGGSGFFGQFEVVVLNPVDVTGDDTTGNPVGITHNYPGEVGDLVWLEVGLVPNPPPFGTGQQPHSIDQQMKMTAKKVEVDREGRETMTLTLTNGY
jgi:hypothetical protein